MLVLRRLIDYLICHKLILLDLLNFFFIKINYLRLWCFFNDWRLFNNLFFLNRLLLFDHWLWLHRNLFHFLLIFANQFILRFRLRVLYDNGNLINWCLV